MDLTSGGSSRAKEPSVLHSVGFLKHISIASKFQKQMPNLK